jgi:hypothetical protein
MYYYQHCPTCYGAYCAIFRENFIVGSPLLLRVTIIYIFYCIDFFWYIKHIITVRKMHGIESSKIGFGYVYYYRLISYTFI